MSQLLVFAVYKLPVKSLDELLIKCIFRLDIDRLAVLRKILIKEVDI